MRTSVSSCFLALGLCLACSTMGAQDLAILDSLTNPATGNTYLLLEPSSWVDAEARAVELGGNLVAIGDQAEHDWMIDNFGTFAGGPTDIWLGLNDQVVEGTFEWSNGEPVNYTNWGPGEPNDAGGGEDYAHVWAPIFPQWNDVANSGAANTIYGLAEIPDCGLVRPDDLACTSTGGTVDGTFANNGPYAGGIDVFRDGVLLATLDPGATSFSDPGACVGSHRYLLRASDGAACFAYSDICVVDIGVTEFASLNTPLGIPNADPLGLADTIDFTDSITISNVDVRLDVTHTWVRDLGISVTSPATTEVTLKEYIPGQTTDVDHIHTTFDDQGIPYDEEQLPNDIFMQPSGPGMLSDFNGEDTLGLWTLLAIDFLGADAGTLDAWAVRHNDGGVCGITAPADLSCSDDGMTVTVDWDNGANVYTSVEIIRNGALLETLAGSPSSYSDSAVVAGSFYTYEVRGIDDSTAPCCAALSDSCTVALGVADLVWAHPDQDTGTTDSATAIETALASFGLTTARVGTLPPDLSGFDRVWVVLGTYTDNHVLTAAEGQILRDFCVEESGRLYVESGDTWGFDAPTPLDEVDGIDSAASFDGGAPPDGLNFLSGQDSGQGLDLVSFADIPYSGENAWIDHLAPDFGSLVWLNSENGDPIGVHHDATVSGTPVTGDYRVISQSWEFGGFGSDLDREALMDRYLDALGFNTGTVEFVRGDANGDGLFNGLIDGLMVLNFQFVPGSPAPPCLDAADADDSGVFNGLVDGLIILNFQFVPGSPPPPPPGPATCGPDPTDDATDCLTPPDLCT